jgi:hypothetical protein
MKGRQNFTQVQVSQNGSLLPAIFTISRGTIPIQVTMDDLDHALRRLPSGVIQGGDQGLQGGSYPNPNLDGHDRPTSSPSQTLPAPSLICIDTALRFGPLGRPR